MDILLVLLIIFMVAVPMAVTSIQRSTCLRRSRPDEREAERTGLHLDPEVQGAIFIAEKRKPASTTLGGRPERQVRRDRPSRPRRTISASLIRADADVLYAPTSRGRAEPTCE
ncbi:hypothetical protein ACRAWD_04040 [Caulobacter segnis]